MFSKDLKQFLDEHYKPAPALALPTKEVRDAYKLWAEKNNKSTLNYTSFNNVVGKEYKIEDGFIHGITFKDITSTKELLKRISEVKKPIQLEENMEKAAKIAYLKMELMELIAIKDYLVKQSMEAFEKAEKKLEEINVLKNELPSQ